MKRLSEKLLECLSINLGLPPNYIQEALGELHQDLLINHYPPCPNPELTVGANKHTDLGGVTCLWQLEDVVGLQVLKDGEWYPIKPLDGAYIINVADMVEVNEFTNLQTKHFSLSLSFSFSLLHSVLACLLPTPSRVLDFCKCCK